MKKLLAGYFVGIIVLSLVCSLIYVTNNDYGLTRFFSIILGAGALGSLLGSCIKTLSE